MNKNITTLWAFLQDDNKVIKNASTARQAIKELIEVLNSNELADIEQVAHITIALSQYDEIIKNAQDAIDNA